MKETIPIKTFIDDETDRSPARKQKHDRVDPGDMIWQEEKSARRKIFASARGDAINEARETQPEKSDRTFSRGKFCH